MTRERVKQILEEFNVDQAMGDPDLAILAAVAEATEEERRRCIDLAIKRREIYTRKACGDTPEKSRASYAADAMTALISELNQEQA